MFPDTSPSTVTRAKYMAPAAESVKEAKAGGRVNLETAWHTQPARMSSSPVSSDIVGVGSWAEANVQKRSCGQQRRYPQYQTFDLEDSSALPELKRSLPLDHYVEMSMKEDPWTSHSRG